MADRLDNEKLVALVARGLEPNPTAYDIDIARLSLRRLGARIEHSERHRAINRRRSRERGHTIVALCAKLRRQRKALRELAASRGSRRLASALERGSDLHRQLRHGPEDSRV